MFLCVPVVGLSQNLDTAKKLFDDKKYKEARRELEMILKSDAKNQTAHFILGKTFFSTNV